MRSYIPKKYGEYQIKSCPFCNRQATQKNAQGLDVCFQHIKSVFEEIKCTCGSWLEQKVGKFGPYFNCLKCGNINFNKAMEMKALMGSSISTNTPKTEIKAEQKERKERKEIIITSRDVDYF